MSGDVVDLVTGYARAGIGVFPLTTAPNGVCSCGWAECPSPGKHPVIRNAHRKADPQRGRCKGECGRLGHGVHDATTDPGVIAEWLAAYPGCNWGGQPPAGVVVLDVDPRNGGDATLDALEAQHGPLPSTLTARTGSGGWHIWLTYNGPSRGRLGQGIDVKKQGGYLVLPPSVHACGGTYTWTNRVAAKPAPRWVRTMLNPPVTRRELSAGSGARIDPLVTFVASSPEGERNVRLFWAACRAHESGLDPAPLLDAATGIGLSAIEAQAAIRSAENAPPRKATPS